MTDSAKAPAAPASDPAPPADTMTLLLNIDDQLAVAIDRAAPTPAGSPQAADFQRLAQTRRKLRAQIDRLLESELDEAQAELSEAMRKLTPINIRLQKAIRATAELTSMLDIASQVLDVAAAIAVKAAAL